MRFFRRLRLLILLAAPVYAQTAAPAPSSALPQNWYGAFASYDSTAHPGVAAGFTEASLMSTSQQLYSYNTWDLTLIKQPKGAAQAYTYQSAPRAGVGMILKSLGPFYLVGFGNLGVATTGQNASLATSAGGIVLWKIGKTNWTLFGGYHVLNTGALGGSKNIPEFGLGRKF